MARFDLSDAEWAIIAPLLPEASGKENGRPRDDDRKVLNGILLCLAHRDAVARFARALRPVHDGVQSLQSLGEERNMARRVRGLETKSPQSLQLFESSIIRAHQHAAGGKRGPG